MEHEQGDRRISRRAMMAAGASTMGAAAAIAYALRQQRARPVRREDAPADGAGARPMGDEAHMELMRPGDERIVFLLYPGFTALDVIGPHHVFINMVGARVQLAAASMDPVATDTGFSVTPQVAFDELEDKQTLVLVPGGTTGTLDALANRAYMRTLRRLAGGADLVGSVCTGSLVLAAAGLLDGYAATGHWLARDALRAGGARVVHERFVEDRDRVTGAGVTAGIDFALRLVEKWRGTAYAKGVQLFMEYDPSPRYDCGAPGSPETDPGMRLMLEGMHEPFSAEAARAIERALASG